MSLGCTEIRGNYSFYSEGFWTSNCSHSGSLFRQSNAWCMKVTLCFLKPFSPFQNASWPYQVGKGQLTSHNFLSIPHLLRVNQKRSRALILATGRRQEPKSLDEEYHNFWWLPWLHSGKSSFSTANDIMKGKVGLGFLFQSFSTVQFRFIFYI